MQNKTILFKQNNTSKPWFKRYSGLFSVPFLLILIALTSWQCSKDEFTGEVVGVCPEVTLIDPIDGSINVVTSKRISATFNEAMNPTTINVNTFFVKKGADLIQGSVLYTGLKATFVPANLLEANTVYSATITRGAADPMGNVMKKDTTWFFNTGAIPTVVLTDPLKDASDVPLNKIITADFSTVMDGTTFTNATFKLKQGTANINGFISYAGSRASFDPTIDLVPNQVYTATITRDVKDVLGNSMAKDTTWSFATGTLPIITITSPKDGAVDVVRNTNVTATFSKLMNGTTIDQTSFTLKQGNTSILGLVTYSDMTAQFNPIIDLLPGLEYTAKITQAVKDPAGNTIEKDSTWKFTTGNLIVPVLPFVTLTDPADAAPNVPLNKVITATFSKAMDLSTINSSTFLVKRAGIPVLGFVNYAGLVGTFTPASPLQAGATYNCTINTGAKDMDGNALATDTLWSFTTVPPVVQFNVNLSILPLNSGTVTGAGLYNTGASVTVSATPFAGFEFVNWTEGGSPVSTLDTYTFVLNNNRTLVANFSAIVSGPPGVDLGTAGNFAVLAGSGVSNTGVTTTIKGDVGSFPTATMNGLLSGNVNGLLYTVADPLVGTAKTDLTTAYNDAQGRSLDAISLPGQLGGLTLAPGLYVNSSTSGISGTGANGILTLNAGGNPNAVWIFKMGSTLITGSGTSIVLAGGAKAKNIYWSVGTSATLGTNSIFFGNILADQSITLTTGASLTGRALTRIGAVTLDTNVVTKP